jgi:hypothetical protein
VGWEYALSVQDRKNADGQAVAAAAQVAVRALLSLQQSGVRWVVTEDHVEQLAEYTAGPGGVSDFLGACFR